MPIYALVDGIFLNLTHDGSYQQDLFDKTDRTRQTSVMKAMDQINQKMGSNTLKLLAAGLSVDKPWATAFDYRSAAFTTDWEQLVVVGA